VRYRPPAYLSAFSALPASGLLERLVFSALPASGLVERGADQKLTLSSSGSWVMRPMTSFEAKLSDMARITPGTTATS